MNALIAAMSIASKVREIYEQRPYPAANKRTLRGMRWNLAAMEWINAVWQPAQPSPSRILVAGCGAGAEAFALCKRFPRSEIVAVDFSPRSISLARDLQMRTPGMQNIRFAVGDLASSNFARTAGRNFNFISCHGVLSYIADPERVLGNLAGCLAEDGALHLGVNGTTHPSANLRKVLPDFGFEMHTFQDAPQLRRILSLMDALAGNGVIQLAKREPEYLAGDLFGPLILNLPLANWVKMARKAGLHLRGNYTSHRMLRSAINNGTCELLMPRSRADVAELLDILVPLPFHRAVFAKQPEARPPWEEPDKLLAWRPVVTPALRRYRWPKHRGSWNTFRNLKIKSPTTNTLIELRVPEWELEILRKSDGVLPLCAILAGVVPPPQPITLRRELYLLYHLALLNFFPPVPGVRERDR
jgi:SAM-dependent methyltransferase